MRTWFFDGGAGGSAAVTVNFTAQTADATDGTSFSFTDVAIGTANADRHVIICASGRSTSPEGARTMTATIGGIATTQVAIIEAGAPSTSTFMHIAAVPTGATATIALTFSGTMDFCGLAVWEMHGASITPSDTATSVASPVALTIDCPASGVIIAFASCGGTNAPTYTWAEVTEDFDATSDAGNNHTHTGASDAFVAAQTNLAVAATLSAAPDYKTGLAASFGPA